MGGTGSHKNLLAEQGTANDMANQYNSQALGISSALTPTLTAQMVNPQGYNPTTMGQMQTAAEQSAGGGNAAAAGQAGLRAARTRNAGSEQAATAEGSRNAGQELSQVNAGIQTNNANLKAKQQAGAESGLGSLYGEDVNAGNNALGLGIRANEAAGQSKPGFWQGWGQQYADDWLKNAMNPGGGGGGGGGSMMDMLGG